MELRDPVVAYTAATNVEAQLVKVFLVEKGIDCCATEDLSLAGLWQFGYLPGIHKPQVWVSSQDLVAARRILLEYETGINERRRVDQQNVFTAESTIEACCEECNMSSSFPAAQFGTVQECPKCGAFIDVGETDESDPYWLESETPEED